MTIKSEILTKLKSLHPSEAIALIESIGKQLRQENSIRISKNMPAVMIEMDRPDLEQIR